MKVLLSLFLLLGMIACSGSKSTNEVEGEDAGIEMAEGDEFSEDFADDGFGDDAFGEETTDEVADSGDSLMEEASEEIAMSDSPMEEAPMQAAPVQLAGGSNGTYQVQKNDTLMLIAFKIYGDYEKWRELARWNSDKLNSSFTVSEGMVLTYEEPAEKFVWNPQGNPYLIKRGDSLGSISSTTYGTKKFWKNIWDNNRPMIKDPNIIFAGFTLYTPVIESRDIANSDI